MLLGRAEGDLLVAGQSSLDRPVHQIAQHMNIVFQSPDDQITNLTVEDEIVFGLENRKMPRPEMQAKLEEVLDICQLHALRDRHVWRLSGGEKQRVAMASIIALEPDILLLDEPTSNLDPQGEREVWEAVARIRSHYGATILLVQHNIDNVLDEVDRVILIEAGSVCFNGTPAELVSDQRWKLRDEWGLWLPQATEAGLRLQDRGIDLDSVPLATGEAEAILSPWCSPQNSKRPEDMPKEPNNVLQKGKTPLLQVNDLRFRYDEDTPEVLKGVSFSMEHGERVVILGPNGAGKSTLALQLIGLLKPTQGIITINGQDTQSLTPAQIARQIAYVFQYPEHQFIANTVLQEMMHGLQALDIPEDEALARVEEMLSRIGLWECRDRHPYNLSMGQKRRLSVACMLVVEPEAIILDEPTFGQDWKNATELVSYLRALNQEGNTVVLITHNMRLVAEYAYRALVLVDGEIVFDGSPRTLFEAPEILVQACLEPPPICGLGETLLGMSTLSVSEFCALVETEEESHG
jgi:energy-coupling factor transport system ATP-binding protein